MGRAADRAGIHWSTLNATHGAATQALRAQIDRTLYHNAIVDILSELANLDIVYETVSATATVGLTRNLTSNLNNIGKIIMILTMYLGRVGPISLAIVFGLRKTSPNIIKNPTEEISVG